MATITLAHPPVNALNQALREALRDSLASAVGDPLVSAIVIAAEGKAFSAGADVRELGRGSGEPELAALLETVENCPKPVIAAIQGTALGSGFELALACHYRLALEGAQMGLPDVALGVVPGAGGSQRLAHIAGARAALDMLISGRPLVARLAVTLGLVDKVVRKNLDRAAFGSARNMALANTPPRPSGRRTEGFRDPKAYLDLVAARRRAHETDKREAVHRAIDLVEAALLLPIEAGLAMERVAFDDLVDSDQARSLRHAFLAERRAARAPAARGAVPRQVDRVALVGGGRWAPGIARACLAGGLAVTLADPAPDLRVEIESGLSRAVAARKLTDEALSARLARLDAAPEAAALAQADLALTVLPGDPAPAVETLTRVAQALRPGAVLAIADPGAEIDALALASGRPADVLGLRCYLPAQATRLVEVAPGARGAADLAATGFALARRIGKVGVWSGPGAGGVGGRAFGAGLAAARHIQAAGMEQDEIDAAMQDFGFGIGPFAVAALVGAEGFRLPDPGQPARRGFSRAEIARRVVLAMAVEGARLVERGGALKPGDVDAALLLGFGFPRFEGGPMLVADRMGLLAARKQMRLWAEEGGAAADIWGPVALWDDLIKTGRHFDSLDG